MSSSWARAISTVRRWFAPGATPIWFRPSASTAMSAVPVAASPTDMSPSTPMPCAASRSRMAAPELSSPTQPIIRTSAPSRRAATA